MAHCSLWMRCPCSSLLSSVSDMRCTLSAVAGSLHDWYRTAKASSSNRDDILCTFFGVGMSLYRTALASSCTAAVSFSIGCSPDTAAMAAHAWPVPLLLSRLRQTRLHNAQHNATAAHAATARTRAHALSEFGYRSEVPREAFPALFGGECAVCCVVGLRLRGSAAVFTRETT